MLKKMRNFESASLAKERLQAVFVTDQLHCTGAQIKEMETDLLHSVKKYFKVVESKDRTRLIQKEDAKDEYVLIFEAVIKKE